MRLEQGVWDDVHVGAVIYDPIGEKAWRVIAEREGWFQVQGHDGSLKSLPPQKSDVPIQFIVPSDGEMIHLLQEELGARTLELLGALASQPARASRRPMSFPRKGSREIHRANSHLKFMHNVYTDDIKTMKGLHEAHDALHADAGHLMRHAHHHTGD